MRPQREAIRPDPGSSFCCYRRQARGFPFNWHAHPEIELTLIVRGRGQRFVGDHIAPYREGDLVLHGPDLPHTYRSDGSGPHEAIVVQMPKGWLDSDLLARPETRRIARLIARADRGLRFEGPAARRAGELLPQMPQQPPPKRLLTLLGMLEDLAEAKEGRPLTSAGYAPARAAADRDRLARVLAMLQARLRAAPSQREAAAAMRMSPASFARFFRRATGRTYGAYLQELRVGEACRLLTETTRPIGEVARHCGFASQPHFSRSFKALQGMTPRAYRRTFGGD